MYDLSRHPYFEEYVDEKSGVKSYILKKIAAPIQQNLYFNVLMMIKRLIQALLMQVLFRSVTKITLHILILDQDIIPQGITECGFMHLILQMKQTLCKFL